MSHIGFFERHYIPTYDNPKEVTPGTIEYDYETCKKDSLCARICPANAIIMVERKPILKPEGQNECIACGCCVAICPTKSIKIVSRYTIRKGFFKTIGQGDLKPPRLSPTP